ncbi:UNVERIFIED_CONTAM: hypothetical protein NCL1_16240 [Trichonephila clavipes]
MKYTADLRYYSKFNSEFSGYYSTHGCQRKFLPRAKVGSNEAHDLISWKHMISVNKSNIRSYQALFFQEIIPICTPTSPLSEESVPACLTFTFPVPWWSFSLGFHSGWM